MNKTKKDGTFMQLKIVFRVRGTQKESLKQSIMIEKQRTFARNSLLFEYVFSVISLHFPILPAISQLLGITSKALYFCTVRAD